MGKSFNSDHVKLVKNLYTIVCAHRWCALWWILRAAWGRLGPWWKEECLDEGLYVTTLTHETHISKWQCGACPFGGSKNNDWTPRGHFSRQRGPDACLMLANQGLPRKEGMSNQNGPRHHLLAYLCSPPYPLSFSARGKRCFLCFFFFLFLHRSERRSKR